MSNSNLFVVGCFHFFNASVHFFFKTLAFSSNSKQTPIYFFSLLLTLENGL